MKPGYGTRFHCASGGVTGYYVALRQPSARPVTVAEVEIFGDFQCPDTNASWFEVVLPLLADRRCARAGGRGPRKGCASAPEAKP